MDYKTLLPRIQSVIREFESSGNDSTAITAMARTILRHFRNELGMTGARLYEVDGDRYELVQRIGDAEDEEIGIFVDAEYPPIAEVLDTGIILMEPNDPGVDPVIEKNLGAGRFAAFTLGDRCQRILSFNVAAGAGREDILFSLSLIRQAISQRMREQHFESILEEAQSIQYSILPQRPPHFPGFELHGRTSPAEGVSGDYFDFIAMGPDILGLAIADATGHGLPAALVVRDIHMGLRMGVDRDFKIVRTLEKLNQIIHRSRLSTKFVSLFYGELEANGTFIYSNAGHPAPFMIKANGGTLRLSEGGPILGPTPEATYYRGYVKLEPGDVLCLYTDGIVEATDAKGTEFGVDRLIRLVKRSRALPAGELAQLVLDRVAKWERTPNDDRTVVIARSCAGTV
jgi:sigma-B regulation protein RsbU (phosphoserine phosphatase)